MKYKLPIVVLLVLVLTLFAQPVAAAESNQGTGGVHFGPYTLESGNRYSEDLVVFGGPVVIEDDAEFDGDLTVFGPAEVEDRASVDGNLVIFGTLDMDGLVDGDVFCAGAVSLGDDAHITGDLSTAGVITRNEGAVVDGDITTIEEGDFEWDMPIEVLGEPDVSVVTATTPLWVRWITNTFKAMAGVVILTLVALLISSIWPEQMQRVSGTIESDPLPTFGTGLLTLIVAVIVLGLLFITICLSLFAIVGMILVGLALLVGWVALGYLVGQRFMGAVAAQTKTNTVVEAVVGTALVSLLVAVTGIFGPLQVLIQFVLLPLAAGAVVLTRFGTRSYTGRDTSGVDTTTDVSQNASSVPAPSVFIEPDEVTVVPEPRPVMPEAGELLPPPIPDAIDDSDETSGE